MSSEKCMRHKGVLHKRRYPMHDELTIDGRLFILGDSWGRKTRDTEGLRPKNQQKQQKATFQVIQILSTRGRTLTLSCISSVQFSSVAQSCPTLCDPMNRSTPGLPVHHQRPEFTQTHVHRVGDAIQASHPLSSPSPPAPNPSQHQRLFQ